MTVKKEYNVGDEVWVYGITKQNRITKGKVVHSLEIPGFGGTYYVISIPTEIEPLLEIRTWETMSQDSQGPIGAFRDLKSTTFDSTIKFVTKVGFAAPEELEEFDEPTADEIHAALEKSQKNVAHAPLNLKPEKPKRRYFKKKPKA